MAFSNFWIPFTDSAGLNRDRRKPGQPAKPAPRFR